MTPSPSKDGRVWTRPKGHWPRGRLRNAWVKDDWPAIRERTDELIRSHPLAGERSGAALATHLGVWPRTVNKWLRGLMHPPESIRGPILAWLKRQEALVRSGMT